MLPARIRYRGLVEYAAAEQEMRAFTADRGADTPDEIWFLEHPDVYTLGINADPVHVIAAGSVPVVNTDRGGQVTWHGPGQLVVYPLLDIRRAGLGVRDLISAMETATVNTLAGLGISAAPRADAPGVYIDGAKVASVGIRVRRGGSYHGLAVNVSNDLSGFAGINPCGHEGLAVTRLADQAYSGGPSEFAALLLPELLAATGLLSEPLPANWPVPG